MIRIAVLGCGRIGVMHAANIAAHPRARLAGVQDINAAAAEKTAAATGAPVFASAAEIFDFAVDVVFGHGAGDCDRGDLWGGVVFRSATHQGIRLAHGVRCAGRRRVGVGDEAGCRDGVDRVGGRFGGCVCFDAIDGERVV